MELNLFYIQTLFEPARTGWIHSLFTSLTDLRSGARKPLQPRYKIEFHVLARCGRCSLYSLQVEEVQMNTRCQHFPSVHSLA